MGRGGLGKELPVGTQSAASVSVTCMRYLVIALFLFAAMISVNSQQGPAVAQKYDIKRCSPKAMKLGRPRSNHIHFHKGDKPSGRVPVIAFQILESGEVADARLKQSSGFAEIDKYALDWVRSTSYSKRPGCGILETNESVAIDFTAADPD
jgi:TonB family protein